MDYSKFIKPREVEIGGETFSISQIPAIESQGLYRVVAKSISENGLIGMTMLPVETVRGILAYVAAKTNDQWFSLDTESRINGHVSDKATMQKLVVAMIRENWGFLVDGSLLDVLGVQEAGASAS